MKHSLRLARMSRMDLTPNPPVEPGDPSQPVDETPTTVFAAPSAPPAVAWRTPHAPPAPVTDPSMTWQAPPMSWDAAPPATVEPTGAEQPEAEHPGSAGEHLLQQAYGTKVRAGKFYDDQMSDHLNPAMIEFIGRMEMAFIATADAHGEADCSFRAGPPGFIQVLDDRHVAYPEYRGNGVLASLGNISENPHIGIMLLDFMRDRIGLHINGRAMIVDDDAMRAEFEGLPEETVRGRMPERWVLVEVDEAYIHCRKHIPHLQPASKDTRDQTWGTDDVKRKGGDYFGVRAARKAAAAEASSPALEPACQSSVNGS